MFCFARRVSAGGNAGAGFQIIRAIFARKRFELRSAIAKDKINGYFSSRLFYLSGCREFYPHTNLIGPGGIEPPLHPPQGCGLPLSDSPYKLVWGQARAVINYIPYAKSAGILCTIKNAGHRAVEPFED